MGLPKTENAPSGVIQRGVFKSISVSFELLDLSVKRVLTSVFAVLHELQAMWCSPLVFCGGVTRDARPVGLATNGALKMNNHTTFRRFFCHGVLLKKVLLAGVLPIGQHRYGGSSLLSTPHFQSYP